MPGHITCGQTKKLLVTCNAMGRCIANSEEKSKKLYILLSTASEHIM